MVIIPLPTTDEPLRTQQVSLDGLNFRLTFNWSERQDVWSMRVADADNVELISGAVLVPYVDLLRTVAQDARPGGVMYLFTPHVAAPTIDTIGDATLTYVTEAEVATLQS